MYPCIIYLCIVYKTKKIIQQIGDANIHRKSIVFVVYLISNLLYFIQLHGKQKKICQTNIEMYCYHFILKLFNTIN